MSSFLLLSKHSPDRKHTSYSIMDDPGASCEEFTPLSWGNYSRLSTEEKIYIDIYA